MRALLSRPGYRSMLASEGISAVGDWMATVALMVLALEATGSSTAVAGILILRLAPSAFAGPLAARLVGRWHRRRLLLTMHLMRAAIVALIPLSLSLWWIYLCAFLLEVCSVIFLPARDSVIPDLAGSDDELEVANGMLLGSSYGTIPLGAALFGITAAATTAAGLGGRIGAGIPLWIDAATFLVAFLLVSRIAELHDGHAETPGSAEQGSIRDAFAIPLVRQVVPAAAAASLGIGSLFSLGIVFVRDVMQASNAQFGVLIALFGLGAAGGIGVLRRVDTDHFTRLQAGVTVQGVVVALMSLAPSIGLLFIGALVFGACTSAALASGMSYLQVELAERERTLAFVAFHVVIRVALGMAAIASGMVDDILTGLVLPVVGSVPATRVVLFCAGIVIVSGAWLARANRGRETLATEAR